MVPAASDVWLITGIPGTGKSTVARQLASRLPRAAHVEGDCFQEWIVSGAVLPGQHPRAEEQRQIRLSVRLQCLLARAYARAGFVPVLDYPVVTVGRLATYRRALRQLEFHLVVLNPGKEPALRRDRARPEKTVAEFWVHMEDELLRELAGVGLWINGDELGIEETVDLILREQARARLPSPGRR